MSENVNQIDKEGDRNRMTLYQLLDRAHQWFEAGLLESFEKKGVHSLGRAELKLIANLDCGTTYSSELARRLGVSRQAVAKLVGNLVQEGIVTLQADPDQRNTKQIVMTEKGKELIRHAVEGLDAKEKSLAEEIGIKSATNLRNALEAAKWGNG